MSNGERDSVKISNSRAMGVIVLIALLFLFQVVTFVVQKVRMRQVAAVAGAGAGGGAGISGAGPSVAVGSKTFPFNPNTITEDSLQMLGFSQRQAASIIKYRTKGGKFRVKRDFAKMYVVDSVKYAALEPFILLPDRLPGKRNVTNKPKNVTNGVENARIVTEAADSVTKAHQASAPQPAPASKYGTRLPKEKYVCNLNTADSAALVQLYGIGGYYARKILQYRERLGGSFVDTRQLLEIEGFTQERFEKIKGNVVVLEEDVKGFSLLKASREELERHPYIGPYAARGVETYLRLKGKGNFTSDMQLLEALVKERVISAQNADKLKEYLLHL
jgi:DNA uptake protein ComE-like DNA-binding protein